MKKIILINKYITKEKLDRYLEKISQINIENIIIWIDDKLPNYELDCKLINIKDYQNKVAKENDYWGIALDWVDQWNRNTRFYKEIMYEGYSLWWLVRNNFYYWLQPILVDIDVVKELTMDKDVEEIFVIGSNQYWQDIIEIVANYNRINVTILLKDSIIAALLNKGSMIISRLKKELLYITVAGLRTSQGICRLLLRRIKSKKKNIKVLMFTHDIDWQNIRDPITGRMKRFDAQMGLLLEEALKRNIEVIAFDRMTFPLSGFIGFLEKKYPYVPQDVSLAWIKSRLSLINSFVKDKKKVLLNNWNRLKQGKNFQSSFNYNGLNIEKVVLKKINSFFPIWFPSLIVKIESYKRMLIHEKPDVIVILNENGSGRPIMTASKLLGIPAVGFQHGTIHKWHIDYIYPKDVDRNTIPLCDKTVVYGEFYKDILVKESVYQESEVQITGQSRLDFLKYKDRIYEKTRVYRRWNISPSKRLVLYTSQPDDSTTRRQAVSWIFSALRKMDDIYMIIKLHPGEKMDGFYESTAKNYNITNLQVTKDDLYELLYASDVVLSRWSTAVSEAVIFGKPVVMLQLPSNIDPMRLSEQNLVIRVTNAKDLGIAVGNVLESEKVNNKLKIARDKFISDHYFKIDGKSTERIADLIENVGKEKYK